MPGAVRRRERSLMTSNGASHDSYCGAPGAVHARSKRGASRFCAERHVDDPDAFIERATEAGATPIVDRIRAHHAPWGKHRQGGFYQPVGHPLLSRRRTPLVILTLLGFEPPHHQT